MKIQIIYLDPHDDHASARDKLNACQAQRAALVWPDRGRVLTRRLDLVLVDRHARNRGVQIGLISHDPTIRQHAVSIGIPAFDTVDDATQGSWLVKGQTPTPSKERDRTQIREILLEGRPRDRPKTARWMGVVGLGALLLLATALLPSATIVLLPEIDTQVLELDITLSPDLVPPTGIGIIAATSVSVAVQGELSRSTSTYVSVPTEYASGSVEFTNLTSEPITIPSGTGVRTTSQPTVRFETTEVASLPAGTGATTLVEIRALEAGRSGNVSTGSILAVEGLLGLDISVRNPEAISGGRETQRAAVSETDLTRLQQGLTQILLDDAEAALAADLGEGQVLVAESLVISRLINQQFDHAPGEASETVELSLHLEITGLTYMHEDLENALLLAMQGELADGIQGIPGSLEMSQDGEDTRGADGLLTLSFIASQSLYEAVDLASLAYQLQWRTPQQATSIIEEQDSLTIQEISIWPGWFPRLPLLAPRITILWDWESS